MDIADILQEVGEFSFAARGEALTCAKGAAFPGNPCLGIPHLPRYRCMATKATNHRRRQLDFVFSSCRTRTFPVCNNRIIVRQGNMRCRALEVEQFERYGQVPAGTRSVVQHRDPVLEVGDHNPGTERCMCTPSVW